MWYTLYSKQCGHRNPKTLDLVNYVDAIDKGTLTPNTASLGFMTFVQSPVVDALTEAIKDEDKFIADFRKSYVNFYPEIAAAFEKDPIEAARVSKAQLKAKFKKANFTSTITTALRKSAATGDYVPLVMPSPLLQLNGVTGIIDENRKLKSPLSTTNTPQSGNTPTFNVTPTTREAAKHNMLRSMRIPLQYAWTFYHDKHADGSNYEGRLTELHADIVTLKKFWEVINSFPFELLKMKDSVHYFKRSVKPVWEDARNVNGGSFTLRVPKDKAIQTYIEILLLAIGESFADVIQKGDDLCGISLSHRFNAYLITIWNRDSSNQKSIDGILSVVLEGLSEELKPKEGSYYYKKHSDHAGFSEAIVKAKEVAEDKNMKEKVTAWRTFAKKEGEAFDAGKIPEAKVTVDEADAALLKEDEEVKEGDLVSGGLTDIEEEADA